MKRKDVKGRVLKPNELQRKDGRYEYRYKDITGEKKVYIHGDWFQLIRTQRIKYQN